MRSSNSLILLALPFLLTLLTCKADARTVVKREIRGGNGEEVVVGSSGMPQKRPFCNAFTGCGRKRSDTASNSIAPLVANFMSGESEDEYLARLSRRIMTEARLWELLQQRLAEAFLANGQGYYTNEVGTTDTR